MKIMLNKKAVSSFFAVLIVVLMVASMFALQPSLVSTVNAQSTQTTNAQSDPISTVPSNLLQYEWPRFGYDGSGTRFSPGPAPSSPNIQWSIPISMAGDQGGLQAFDGKLFVATTTGTEALDPETSTVIWTNNATGPIQMIDETYMMIGNNCYETATGTLVWTGPTGFSASSVVAMGGYVPTEKMFFTALTNSFTHSLQAWKLDDPSQPPTLAWARPDLTVDNLGQLGQTIYGNGKLFFFGLGQAMAIDAKTGNTVWQVPLAFSPTEYGGCYYMGLYVQPDLAGNIFALNATNGALVWTFNPGGEYNYWSAQPAAAYGMIYYHNQNRNVYAINATTGQMVWSYLGPGHFYAGNPIVADGMVYECTGSQYYIDPYTGQNNGREYACLNATTGQLIWKLPLTTAEQHYEESIIAYGNLYLGTVSYDGNASSASVGLTLSPTTLWCISDQLQNWSMFGNDASHSFTGSGPYTLNLAFKFQTDAGIMSSVAIVNGVGYVGSLDHNIYAFNAETGNCLWNYTIGAPVKSSPAVVNGLLYTGADDGNVYCLNAATGALVWKTYVGGLVKLDNFVIWPELMQASPTVVNNRVYVGLYDGNLSCLNANSGAVVWNFASGGDIRSTPTVVDNAVYFNSNTPGGNTTLYKLNAADGSVIWSLGIPYGRQGANVQASPTVAAGMVFTPTSGGTYYAINATTSNIIWTYSGNATGNLAGQGGALLAVGSVLYAEGRVFFQDPIPYHFDCVNATNGNVLWQDYFPRESLAPATSALGRVYVVTQSSGLYILGIENGNKLAYYQLGSDENLAAPVLYNSKVYVGSFDGNVYCFEDAPQNAPAPSPLPTSGPTAQPSAAPSTTPTTPTTTPTTPTTTPTTPTTNPTTNPTSATASPSAVPSPAQGSPIETYIIVAAAIVIIVVAAAAAVILRRRQTK